MKTIILRRTLLLILFAWFLAYQACAQRIEKKPMKTNIFWIAGSAIIVGSVLTMPDKEIRSTPLIGVGVVAIGFTIDIRNLRIKKRSKMLRNTAKQPMFKQDYIQPPWK